jgi:hypothetical protein
MQLCSYSNANDLSVGPLNNTQYAIHFFATERTENAEKIQMCRGHACVAR